MKNTIQDLRDHLFASLEHALDEESSISLDRLEASAKIGQVIVNSAKLELQFIKMAEKNDRLQAKFFTEEQKKLNN
jgi:hypothetical protein